MSRATGFWLLAAVLGFLLACASAPSPLYPADASAPRDVATTEAAYDPIS